MQEQNLLGISVGSCALAEREGISFENWRTSLPVHALAARAEISFENWCSLLCSYRKSKMSLEN